ncbi:hypothetical protein HDU76_003504 [Blyttiomyces sp. JEL0837]|nr:hypothetical protein HDU76_003504 [Blyttiomyces sp. JEL0837]
MIPTTRDDVDNVDDVVAVEARRQAEERLLKQHQPLPSSAISTPAMSSHNPAPSHATSVLSMLYCLVLTTYLHLRTLLSTIHTKLRSQTLSSLSPETTHEYTTSEISLISEHKPVPSHIGIVLRPELIHSDGYGNGIGNRGVPVQMVLEADRRGDAIEILMREIAKLACWCVSSGILHLTIYDEKGLLKANSDRLPPAIRLAMRDHFNNNRHNDATNTTTSTTTIKPEPKSDSDTENPITMFSILVDGIDKMKDTQESHGNHHQQDIPMSVSEDHSDSGDDSGFGSIIESVGDEIEHEDDVSSNTTTANSMAMPPYMILRQRIGKKKVSDEDHVDKQHLFEKEHWRWDGAKMSTNSGGGDSIPKLTIYIESYDDGRGAIIRAARELAFKVEYERLKRGSDVTKDLFGLVSGHQSIMMNDSHINLPPPITTALQSLNIGTPIRIKSSSSIFLHIETSTSKQIIVRYAIPTDPIHKIDHVRAEAEGLTLLNVVDGLTPRLLSKGYYNNESQSGYYFISEYIHFSPLRKSPSTIQLLAIKLAELHSPSNKSSNRLFGFDVVTFCGDTRQNNRWEERWDLFFEKRRIRPLVEVVWKEYGDEEIKRLGELVCENVIPALLGKLDIVPVPIHGDLWAGNAAVNSETGQPVIFDPAAFYGHNEYELGIMKMFGGFPDTFFKEYHKHRPIDEPKEQYEQRLQLYELYHHLNHAALFGGSYRSSATAIMDQLVANQSRY